MPNTSYEEALHIGKRLRERVTVVDWSLGIAELQPDDTVHSFLARADELMLADKRARKAGRDVPGDSVAHDTDR